MPRRLHRPGLRANVVPGGLQRPRAVPVDGRCCRKRGWKQAYPCFFLRSLGRWYDIRECITKRQFVPALIPRTQLPRQHFLFVSRGPGGNKHFGILILVVHVPGCYICGGSRKGGSNFSLRPLAPSFFALHFIWCRCFRVPCHGGCRAVSDYRPWAVVVRVGRGPGVPCR